MRLGSEFYFVLLAVHSVVVRGWAALATLLFFACRVKANKSILTVVLHKIARFGSRIINTIREFVRCWDFWGCQLDCQVRKRPWICIGRRLLCCRGVPRKTITILRSAFHLEFTRMIRSIPWWALAGFPCRRLGLGTSQFPRSQILFRWITWCTYSRAVWSSTQSSRYHFAV